MAHSFSFRTGTLLPEVSRDATRFRAADACAFSSGGSLRKARSDGDPPRQHLVDRAVLRDEE